MILKGTNPGARLLAGCWLKLSCFIWLTIHSCHALYAYMTI